MSVHSYPVREGDIVEAGGSGLYIAFGNADHAPGVEEIEDMARLDALVVGRQHEPLPGDALALVLGHLELRAEHLHVRDLEVVFAELELGPPPHVAVAPNGDVYADTHFQMNFLDGGNRAPDGMSGGIMFWTSSDGGAISSRRAR